MKNVLCPRQLIFVSANRFFGKEDQFIADALGVPFEVIDTVEEHPDYEKVYNQVLGMLTTMVVQHQLYYDYTPSEDSLESVLKQMGSKKNKV